MAAGRSVVVGVAAAVVACVLATGAPLAAPPWNVIQAENALPGTPGWAQRPQASNGAIEGYTSAMSIAPGQELGLHVSTRPAARYRVVVYRLGWYGGVGARRVACLPSCESDEGGERRSVPAPDSNGEVRAGWPTTDAITVGRSWVSGYYVASLVLTSGAQAGSATNVYFVVRDPARRESQVLVQVPVNTWEAYNGWGGKSLYDFSSTDLRPANRVSFARPFAFGLPGAQDATGWELPLVRFLERQGYDLSYQTDIDTSFDPRSLLRHRLVVTAGHAEYWTKEMRDAFQAARDSGTNLAFMGANTAYWQVRYEHHRETMVGYKSLYDPNPDPALKTAMFRELTPPRYECELLGIQHQGAGLHWPSGDYTVQTAALQDPWMAGTGFTRGSIVRGVVSVESDTIPGNQTAQSSCGNTLTVFFHRDRGGDKDGNADAVRYLAPSGARVFSSGSHQFVWGLDGWTPNPAIQHCCVDPRLQRFVRNAIDDLGRPAPVRNLSFTARGKHLIIRATAPNDPRIQFVRITRTTGRGTSESTMPVCETRGAPCTDTPPAHGSFFYTAVTVDQWATAAPVSSARVRP